MLPPVSEGFERDPEEEIIKALLKVVGLVNPLLLVLIISLLTILSVFGA